MPVFDLDAQTSDQLLIVSILLFSHCTHMNVHHMKGSLRFNIVTNFHSASSEIPPELTLNCMWMMRDRDVIKPRCESDSLTLPEECGADAGGDTSRWMNIHLSAALQITAVLPTAQSQARNVWTNHERTAGEEPVTTTVDLGFALWGSYRLSSYTLMLCCLELSILDMQPGCKEHSTGG